MKRIGGGTGAERDHGDLLEALRDPPARERVPFAYRASLALVALITVVLPVLSVGLVALVAWGWWIYLRRGDDWVDIDDPRLYVVLRFGPLAVGAILVFFLLKPFLARRAKAPEPFTLDPEGQPRLHAFVERCCAVLGARPPARIDVSLEVNASASFARGLRSVFAGDLALTLGLPVVSNLDLNQLTSILAHEFGHFAQAAGMRFYYLSRIVMAWLVRVAYERDRWDVKLEAHSRRGALVVRAVCGVARLGVWLSRGVLKGLVHAGAAAGGLLSRQMEFDADRNAMRLCGSEAFASALLELPELVVATQWAHGALASAWREGRLADDFVELVCIGHGQLSEEGRHRIRASEEAAPVSMYADHPPIAERVHRARELDLKGSFRSTLPARAVFDDYEELCREVTHEELDRSLGKDLEGVTMVTAAELTGVRTPPEEIHSVIAGYFQGIPFGPVTLALGTPPENAAPDVNEAIARLEEFRASALRAAPLAREHARELGSATEEYVRLTVLHDLLAQPKRLGAEAKAFGDLTRASAWQRLREVELRMDTLIKTEKDHAVALRARLTETVALARCPEASVRLVDAPDRLERLLGAWRAYDALAPASEHMVSIVKESMILKGLFEALAHKIADQPVQAFLGRRFVPVREHALKAAADLAGRPYPFAAREGVMLDRYLFGDLPSLGDDFVATLRVLLGANEQWRLLIGRMLVQLGGEALAIETAFGLEPLPEVEVHSEDASEA